MEEHEILQAANLAAGRINEEDDGRDSLGDYACGP